MAYKTRDEIVQEVIKTIGLVAGTGVQRYTEPKIELEIQNTFDLLFDKRVWEHMSAWYTWALDGTTGRVTTNVTDIIRSWEHIQTIFIADTDRQVLTPTGREHMRVTGSDPLFYTPLLATDADFLTRCFKCWPVDATGSIDVFTKIKPADFVGNHTVPLPRAIMVFGTAWNLLENDGINPDAADRCRIMFDEAYAAYTDNITNRPVGRGGRRRRDTAVIGTLL